MLLEQVMPKILLEQVLPTMLLEQALSTMLLEQVQPMIPLELREPGSQGLGLVLQESQIRGSRRWPILLHSR